MIAVIADDFTGAAEIGGIGLRRGMRVLIETSVSGTTNVDLLVIATDTRSMSADQAKVEIENVTRQLVALNPKFIFKKTDSVLRGNIVTELLAQQQIMQKQRVILVPANPHFGRIIRNGVYYIDETPLADTSFAFDPEFPITSSSVTDILGDFNGELASVGSTDEMPDSGIIIGNVEHEEGLLQWAAKKDDRTLFAGGSGFFDALLRMENNNSFFAEKKPFENEGKTLFVFGSAFRKNGERLVQFEDAGVIVYNLPVELFIEQADSPEQLQKWAGLISRGIEMNTKVAVSTVFSEENGTIDPARIRIKIGQLVKAIYALGTIRNLFIEGGATTSQILANLNIRSLIPVHEIDFGIIQMETLQLADFHLITKPGSYVWPDYLINN